MSLNYARFTVAYWCVLIAVLLPYACTYLAKYPGFGKPRSKGGYDNVEPRAWLAKQQGFNARANAAEANTFEALPFFIGAVIIAHQLGAPQTRLDILATNFTAEGETTAHVIAQALKGRTDVQVTRLARGVPVGSELEYVDLGTIAHAMVDRRTR